MTTTTTPQPKAKKIDPMMNGVAEYLKAGPAPLLQILSRVFRHPGPTPADAMALSRVLCEDSRFAIGDDAGQATAYLVEQPPAAKPEEPKSIADLMSADDKLANDAKALHATTALDEVAKVEASKFVAEVTGQKTHPPIPNVGEAVEATPGPHFTEASGPVEVVGAAEPVTTASVAPATLTGIDRLWDPALTRDYTTEEADELAAAFYAKTGTSAPFKEPTQGESKSAEDRAHLYRVWFKANQERVAALVAAPVTTAPAAPAPVTIEADADKASMRAEIDRLRRELQAEKDNSRAYADKISGQHDAAAKVKGLEAKLDAAKQMVGGIKVELAAANNELAALVLGDAQQVHPALKPAPTADDEGDDDQDDDQDDDAPAPKAKKEPKPKAEKKPKAAKPPKEPKAPTPPPYAGPALPWAYGVAPDQVTAGDSLPNDQKITQAQLRAALVEHIPQGVEVTKLKPKQVITVKGIPHLARQANDTGTRWFLQTLYSQPEWNGCGYGDTYGRPVEGLDDNNETKSKREAGGPDCGRMVKIGAKLYVLTPEKVGTVLTFDKADRNPAIPGIVATAAAIADAMATHSVGEGAKEPEAQPIAPASSTPAAPVDGVPIEAAHDEMPQG